MPLFLLRRATSEDWMTHDPVLAEGEPAVDLTTGFLKIGNGVDPWSELSYRGGPPGPSAYQVALSQGFTGTAEEWIDSLRSTVPGPPGAGLAIDGTVPTYTALPVGGVPTNATYVTLDTGRLYVWSGTGWPAEPDGVQLQGPPGSTSWLDLDDKPVVVAAGATAVEARAAIGAMASSLAPELVTALPASPIMGKLYCLPEV